MIRRLVVPAAVVGSFTMFALNEDRFSRVVGVGALASISFGFWVLFKTEEGWRRLAEDATRGHIVGVTFRDEAAMIAVRAIEELAEHDRPTAAILARDLADSEARYGEFV